MRLLLERAAASPQPPPSVRRAVPLLGGGKSGPRSPEGESWDLQWSALSAARVSLRGASSDPGPHPDDHTSPPHVPRRGVASLCDVRSARHFHAPAVQISLIQPVLNAPIRDAPSNVGTIRSCAVREGHIALLWWTAGKALKEAATRGYDGVASTEPVVARHALALLLTQARHDAPRLLEAHPDLPAWSTRPPCSTSPPVRWCSSARDQATANNGVWHDIGQQR